MNLKYFFLVIYCSLMLLNLVWANDSTSEVTTTTISSSLITNHTSNMTTTHNSPKTTLTTVKQMSNRSATFVSTKSMLFLLVSILFL
jgi:hypothetical protein